MEWDRCAANSMFPAIASVRLSPLQSEKLSLCTMVLCFFTVITTWHCQRFTVMLSVITLFALLRNKYFAQGKDTFLCVGTATKNMWPQGCHLGLFTFCLHLLTFFWRMVALQMSWEGMPRLWQNNKARPCCQQPRQLEASFYHGQCFEESCIGQTHRRHFQFQGGRPPYTGTFKKQLHSLRGKLLC